MNPDTTAPTPDAALRALWDADFDLPHAAATLRISLVQLVTLLRQPAYAEPLEAMHHAAKQCLDLKAAKAVGTILHALHDDLEACDDPAESRRIATALTKAINAATRLTKTTNSRATDRRSGRSVPTVSAANDAAVPPAVLHDEPKHHHPHHPTTPPPNPQSKTVRSAEGTIQNQKSPSSSPSHRITVSPPHPLLSAAGQARAA
jgi:hypothetical protein